MPMQLTPSAIFRAMRSAFMRGMDPRNTAPAFGAAYQRAWHDRARRAARADYQLHVTMHDAATLERAAQIAAGLSLA